MELKKSREKNKEKKKRKGRLTCCMDSELRSQTETLRLIAFNIPI